jgi:hypothetical protein
MMRFMIGLAVGALGYWAYEHGLLPTQMTTNVFGGESTIIRPTPQEVSGRPAEPIPGSPSA